jgi:type II secretory pathway predicted ATPase ExeA
MFTQYFGLRLNPFSKGIDTKALFISRDLCELSSRLDFMKRTRGFFLLTSEPGMGKTVALRQFSSSLNPNQFKVCYIALSSVTVMDFYQGLILALGEEPLHKKVRMFGQIQRLVKTSYYEKNITPVFMLDEAHCLQSGVLADIQMIFNFNMDSENPFLLIFSGHSSLRNQLHLGIHQSLRQRIMGNYHMSGINREEMTHYLSSLLTYAGAPNTNLFNNQASEAIFSLTNGLPRLVNNLATASLTCAYAKKQDYIDGDIVCEAARDIEI